MDEQKPNKVVELLKQPENMATAIVLAAALTQPRENGRGGLATVAQRGVGALAFRGEMGNAQEAMQRQREADRLKAEEQASQEQYRNDSIAVQNRQVATAEARTAQEAAQWAGEATQRDAAATLNYSQARYYDRLPMQMQQEMLKLRLQAQQDRDKYYNDLSVKGLEGYNTLLAGISSGLGTNEEKLAASRLAMQNYASHTQAVAMLREREMRDGTRGYLYMTPEGRVIAAWGNSATDPLAPQPAAGVVPPPAPEQPKPAAAPAKPAEKPAAKPPGKAIAGEAWEGAKDIKRGVDAVANVRERSYTVARVNRAIMQGGTPASADLEALRKIPKQDLLKDHPSLKPEVLKAIYGG